MPDMSTVFDRSKRNGGFMTGPDHSTLGLDRMQNDLAPEGEEPPNLREAEGPDACASCANFMDGMCEQFNTPVEETQVCDAFEPMDEGGEEGGEYAGMGMGSL